MGLERIMLTVQRLDTSVPYAEACRLQEDLVRRGEEALLLCEHPPVITCGTSSRPGDLLYAPVIYERQAIDVVRSPRGGKTTYHGPGQLVGYPIIHLRSRGLTIHAFLRLLEEILLEGCRRFGVAAQCCEGKTGVWCGPRKIGFIGVRVRRGFTFHGFSINVKPQQDPFRLIVPCGMPGLEVTSLEEECGVEWDLWSVADTLQTVVSERLQEKRIVEEHAYARA